MKYDDRSLWIALGVLLIALVITGCATPAAPATETPAAPAIGQAPVENTPAPPAAAAPTDTPQPPTSTPTPAPTHTPTDTPTPAPTPTPTPDCEAAYQEFIATYGRDYTPCRIALRPFDELCPRPEFLQPGDYTFNIELILDASGSMAGAVGGRSKLSIAQQTLTDFIDKLPSKGVNVALRVYGHKGSNKEADRAVSCLGTELIYPFQPLNKDAFKQTIRSFSPTGWTPIARSLRAALDDFQEIQEADAATNVVVLVSDGIETCDGDPVAAAKLLQGSELKTVVHVIGFDVDAEAADQLRAVAQAGGGDYFEARNAEEFEKIFVDLFNLEEWIAYLSCIHEKIATYRLENATQISEARLCYAKKLSAERLDFALRKGEYDKNGDCRDDFDKRFQEREESIGKEMDQVEQWSDFFQKESEKIDAILKEIESINAGP